MTTDIDGLMALTLLRVKLGPWGGGGGHEWDEASYGGNGGGFTGIRSMSIGSSTYVSSMLFEYDDNGQRVMGIRHGKGIPEQIQKEELDFPGEVLTHISGYHNNYVIGSLEFRTNRNRKLGTYGQMVAANEGWRRFEVSMLQAGSIVGFFGRSGDLIDAIGIYVAVWNPDRFFDGMSRQGVVTYQMSPLHLKLREMEKRKKLEVDSIKLRDRKSLLESQLSSYKEEESEQLQKLDRMKHDEEKLVQEHKERESQLQALMLKHQSSKRKIAEKQGSINRLELELTALQMQKEKILQQSEQVKRQLEQEEQELEKHDMIRACKLEWLRRQRDEHNKRIMNLQMLQLDNKLGSDQMHINLKKQQAQITLDIENLQLLDIKDKVKRLQTNWGISFPQWKSDYEKEYAIKEKITKEYHRRQQKLEEQENTIEEWLDPYMNSDSEN
uniref:Jacalin-type lectin domain-containing protein n=1 Tax=Oryza punctata TaxID=4537 RepID=A0A0E0KN42_ORYPU